MRTRGNRSQSFQRRRWFANYQIPVERLLGIYRGWKLLGIEAVLVRDRLSETLRVVSGREIWELGMGWHFPPKEARKILQHPGFPFPVGDRIQGHESVSWSVVEGVGHIWRGNRRETLVERGPLPWEGLCE